jgi:outer membrane protein assembly factor BamD
MLKNMYLCALMQRFTLLFVLTIVLFSCKNEVEKLRTSANVEAQLNKAYELYEKKKYADAAILFEAAMPLLRGNARQEDVYYKYAYCYYNQGLYTSAAYYFTQFASSFSLSDKREEVDFMAAFCNYKQSPVYRLDQKPTYDGIDGLQNFINNYPSSPRVEECNRLIDELRVKLETKSMAEVRLYFAVKEYPSTIASCDNLLKDFPETKNSDEIRYLTVRASYLYATNSVLSKQKERFEAAAIRAQVYLHKHPNGAYVGDVNKMVTQIQQSLKELNNVRY